MPPELMWPFPVFLQAVTKDLLPWFRKGSCLKLMLLKRAPRQTCRVDAQVQCGEWKPSGSSSCRNDGFDDISSCSLTTLLMLNSIIFMNSNKIAALKAYLLSYLFSVPYLFSALVPVVSVNHLELQCLWSPWVNPV